MLSTASDFPKGPWFGGVFDCCQAAHVSELCALRCRPPPSPLITSTKGGLEGLSIQHEVGHHSTGVETLVGMYQQQRTHASCSTSF